MATNERLEFLGDAVLGLVVTDELYHRHPELPEGRLAKLRSAVVNMRALASVARTLDLGSAVRLGRGEEATGGRDKDSILAARALVLRLVAPLLAHSEELGAGLDWKTSLQELGAAHGLGPVTYVVTEDGPDHSKTFTAVASFPEAPGGPGVVPPPSGRGSGRSKKEAEQTAAATAWRRLHAERGEQPETGGAAGGPPAQTPAETGA